MGRGRRRGPGRLLLLQGPTRGRPHDQPGHHGPRRGHHGRPGGHVGCSGTSMAAPHVAGAAAIMAQRHPDWTGRQLKAALMGSAAATPGATPYEQGTGRVDLLRTLAQQVLVEPAGLWAAFPWDGEGERVSTKTITYANSGDTPVTLELGTKGGEVPKLPQERLQVPAHGTASLTLYDLVDERADGLAADMGQRARRAELAKVEATFLASGVAAQGRPYFAPRFGDKPGGFQATRPKT
ncbi:S8 family serine peptidase [Nonomuraea sp. NPDC050643]|uniref:S8 family serine peptidase n=1 Tax=Nonomuraea sp. NPDC050643 TaxID=3155660 RepID=UPI0033DBEA7D